MTTKVSDSMRSTTSLDATKLTGNLPALDGSSLSGTPRRNFIIDGDFTQWPEGTAATTFTNGYGTGTPALFRVREATDGTATTEQSTDVPTVAESGHQSRYSTLIKCTGIDAALAVSVDMNLGIRVTGSDFTELHQQEVTFSFWAKTAANNSGHTYSVSFRNSAVNRSYVTEYTPTSSWTKFTKTLTLDTVGTFLFTEADIGLAIDFDLASGSNYNGTVDTWSAGNFFSSAGNSNFMDSTSNEFYITQVQLVLGSTAPTFTSEAIATVKDQVDYYVQRYEYDTSQEIVGASAFTESTSGMSCNFQFRKTTRTVPVMTNSAASTFSGYDGQAIATLNSFSPTSPGTNGFHAVVGQAGTNWSATGGTGGRLRSVSGTAWIMADARH